MTGLLRICVDCQAMTFRIVFAELPREVSLQGSVCRVVRANEQAEQKWGIVRRLKDPQTAIEWHCTTCRRALFYFSAVQLLTAISSTTNIMCIATGFRSFCSPGHIF